MVTINNNPDWRLPDNWETDWDVRGAVYQVEIAPETQREHVQLYLEFKNAKSMATVKDLCGATAHCEPRRMTRQACFEYCQKQETRKPGTEPTIVGKFPSSWKKTKFSECVDLLVQGATMEDILDREPVEYGKHKRALQDVREGLLSKRLKRDERLIQVRTFYGPSGTGKSRRATWEAKQYMLDNGIRGEPYRKNPGTKWWCDYDGEGCVILDDVSHNDIQPLRMFLRLLDRYPLQIETKGGQCYAGWTRVWITSNEPPCEWFPTTAYGPGEPLYRRLEQEHGSAVEHMTARWAPPVQPVLETQEELAPTQEANPMEQYGIDPALFMDEHEEGCSGVVDPRYFLDEECEEALEMGGQNMDDWDMAECFDEEEEDYF